MVAKKQIHIVVLGGGPGGYEAAHSAARLGAKVTLIERQGIGGSAVLSDVVPSKTLIAASDLIAKAKEAQTMGLLKEGQTLNINGKTLTEVNQRLIALAKSQSEDIENDIKKYGVEVIKGEGRLIDLHTIEVDIESGGTIKLEADYILLAVGGSPRELDSSKPDGKRIFNWTQLYTMTELPEHLIVIGSGVTGAEFASAYTGLGVKVTLISSRAQVLPGEDSDAAKVLEESLGRRGLRVVPSSRAEKVEATDGGVTVTLTNGLTVGGSHCLVAVGAIPNTAGLNLEENGIELSKSGHIEIDSVSRTSVSHIYAAGDCTGVFPLASVAAMQGRVAVAHIMGDAVKPLDLSKVASNIFTNPEIASVGITEKDITEGTVSADVFSLPLANNARAKMLDISEGFVKLFARRGSGTVIGGVVVGPSASELIFPIALAVTNRLTVDQLAETFTVFPSLSGSITESGRRLHKKL
ncbi:MAG: NAD(P)H-quinone dehydrogenase [Micrococcaceae bacterium]